MGRLRPTDWVNWRLYRRAWALCALALLTVLATSFQPQVPPQAQLPPTFTNEHAAALIDRARSFDALYPRRMPGSPGSIDSAQWVRNELRRLGWTATTVPNTTVAPGHDRPVSLVNVEGELRGRTSETVVIFAHRDGQPGRRGSNDSVSTMALLRMAEDLAATRDRRRSYMLVSTDGATLNGAGTRALRDRLERRHQRVVAIIGLDRIGNGEQQLYVLLTPSGKFAPPLGLTLAAREAVRAEGGNTELPSITSQLLRLGAPVTVLEQGQLLAAGLPTVTFTAASERVAARAPHATAPAVGDGLRSVQRLIGTLDTVDALQSAGKTYVISGDRVYRGWALKILIATMLVPFWVVAVDLLVRMRHHWQLASALGSAARAMLAGVWALASLWLLGAIGLLPSTSDRPPAPDTLVDIPLFGLGLWLTLVAAGWILARGPDWRRAGIVGRDHAVGVLCLLVLGVLSALALSLNPYTVLFVLPALHAWLWLSSLRVQGTAQVVAIWCTGLVGLAVGCLAVGAALDLGAKAPWYWLALVLTRTLPPSLALLAACGAGLGALTLVAALGNVGNPALPRLRRWVLALRAEPQLEWRAAVARELRRVRAATPRPGARAAEYPRGRARDATTRTDDSARRSAVRKRVNSR